MYLEHFWLSVMGIFCAGMLSMLGIILAMDAKEKSKRPRMPKGRGFDPTNPINARSELNRQPEEQEWYEVKPGDWMR